MVTKKELFDIINSSKKIENIEINNNDELNETRILIKLKKYCNSSSFICEKCHKPLSSIEHVNEYRHLLIKQMNLINNLFQIISSNEQNQFNQINNNKKRSTKNVIRIKC